MKVLFITRKFLPDVGGMEIAATQLYKELSKHNELRLVRVRSRKALIPLRMLEAAIRGVYQIKRWKPDIVLLQDAVISLISPVISLFHNRVVVVAHGLDVTYENRLYRNALTMTLQKCNAIISISESTQEACRRLIPSYNGIERVVEYSINDDLYIDDNVDTTREALGSFLGIGLEDCYILLTVGRLVARKGVLWFCENCLHKLIIDIPNLIYLVVGDGNMRDRIEQRVRELGLSSHVVFTGEVSKRVLRLAYNAADLFVMPNIPVPSDMEGFGLVALEACSCKLPVVAAEIEGISEALRSGEGGVLVKSKDTNGFISAIRQFTEDGKESAWWRNKSRSFFLSEYSWEKSVRQYQEIFDELLS